MSFNVLTAEISYETNCFSRHKTGQRAFMARYALMGAAAIAERGTENTELAGFIDAGFASADVATVGPTVLVTGQGDFAARTAFAETIADDIWNRHFEVLNDYLSVTEAVAIAATYEPDKGPLIITDDADSPGAGGYGDSTELLRELLNVGVTNTCFAPIYYFTHALFCLRNGYPAYRNDRHFEPYDKSAALHTKPRSIT